MKTYNHQTFTFAINGERIAMYCHTTHTRSGFCHHVYTWSDAKKGEHTRVSYYNRTWERFDYETALYRAAEKLRKATAEPLRLEIKAIGNRESEKTEKFLEAFRKNYAALSGEQRDFLKEHTPHIENQEQAQFVAGVTASLAHLNA